MPRRLSVLTGPSRPMWRGSGVVCCRLYMRRYAATRYTIICCLRRLMTHLRVKERHVT